VTAATNPQDVGALIRELSIANPLLQFRCANRFMPGAVPGTKLREEQLLKAVACGEEHNTSNFTGATTIDRQALGTGEQIEKACSRCGRAAPTQGFCPLNASQDTFECQLTNVPVGLSFHAQTCSV
jgi:hypothetical protein